MRYVVAATYRPKIGEEENIASILREVAPLSRQEPGCRLYEVHQSIKDMRDFFLYEQYLDEAAYLAHQATDYFRRDVLGNAIPRLESRERVFYRTID